MFKLMIPVDESGPWYGRAQDLPELPYCVLSGPIDVQMGVKGVLELGMKKSELHNTLGKPLVPALSDKEALKMSTSIVNDEETGASLGISSFKSEFYGGLFAWIRYDINECVGLIFFDPSAFNKRLHGKQKIVISIKDYTFVVDDQTSKTILIRLLKNAQFRVDFDEKWSDNTVVLKGSHLRFTFNAKNSKLKYIILEKGTDIIKNN